MRLFAGLQGCAVALALVLAGVGCATVAPAPRGDILIGDTHVFPESITSTSAGAVITGSMKGIVFRAEPREAVAKAWIRPGPGNGLLAVFGVLADERSRTLWVCSVPNPFDRKAGPRGASTLVALDLESGEKKAAYAFPAPGGVCNDIAVATDGTIYATDTPNGRILRLARGASVLQVFGQDERLKGIDGLAFSADGTLYVNIVTRGALLRVGTGADGKMGVLTELALSRPIAGPDGFRPVRGNTFLLAEGTGGRIDEVTIEGNAARIRVLREGLDSSPGVTLVGNTAYAIEGKIGFLADPARKGQDPGPFKAYAIPLH